MLLCGSSRESSEVLSAATGEVQVVAGASFKFGDTGAVGVEGLGCGLDTEPCFGARRQRKPTPLRLRSGSVRIWHRLASRRHSGSRLDDQRRTAIGRDMSPGAAWLALPVVEARCDRHSRLLV